MADRKQPIAYLFGKDPALTRRTVESMKPALDIRHVFQTSSAANIERLRTLLQDPNEATPDYIFTGLGFTPAEFKAHSSVQGREKVTWVYGNPTGWKDPVDRKGPPPLEEVVHRMTNGLPEYQKLGAGEKGNVWTWWGENGVERYEG